MNRIFSCLCAAVIGLAALPADATRKQGDLNPTPNNLVDLGDLALLLRARAGQVTLDSAQQIAADVAPQVLGMPPGDDHVDEADVYILLRHVVLKDPDVDGDGVASVFQYDFTSRETSVVVDPDLVSHSYETNPLASDTDGDGLCDGGNVPQNGTVLCYGENPFFTDPTKADTDGDGICDGPGSHPANEFCAGGESVTQTNPSRRDTDGDGLGDRDEDLNFNGVVDGSETHANNPDTDGDTICDGTLPQAWSSEGVSVCRGAEHWNETNPRNPDPPIDPIATVPCPNCFAVFLVPDTQFYVDKNNVYQGGGLNGAQHLNQVMDYICLHRNAWREPSTKKVMPILMTLQLGDLINNGIAETPPPAQEWQRIDAAFDRLDDCGVRYLVVAGNHDTEPPTFGFYESATPQKLSAFNTNFPAPCDPADSTLVCHNPASPFYDPSPTQDRARKAWREHRCADPFDCRTQAPYDEWFIGNGPDVQFGGPASDEPGRHRAAVIEAPNHQQFLFIGLDYSIDPNTETDKNHLAWAENVMDAYRDRPGRPDAATLIFHHQAFMNAGGTPDSPIWDRLVEGHPQVFLTVNGHFAAPPHTAVTDTVRRLLADFQAVPAGAPPPALANLGYGNGWQAVLVFDPDANGGSGEIRFRSYRISDVENYKSQWMYDYISHSVPVNRLHTGTLQETWLLETDYGCPGVGSACPQTWEWNIP